MIRPIAHFLPRPFKHLLRLTALGGLVFCGASCNDSSQSPALPEKKRVSVAFLYPPEAHSTIQLAASTFNSQNRSLSTGAVVRLTPTSFGDLASLKKISSQQAPAHLWLAPSSAAVTVAKSAHPALFTSSDCSSVMSTGMGVVYRPVDSHLFESQGAELKPSVLFSGASPLVEGGPSFVMPAPRYSALGNSLLLLAAASASGTSVRDLSRDAIEAHLPQIKSTQSVVRNYYLSTSDTLSWLRNRDAGSPIGMIATEQAFKNHAVTADRQELKWLPITAPMLLDFPLCALDSTPGDTEIQEAKKVVRSFFAGEEFRKISANSGFNPPPISDDFFPESFAKGLLFLQEHWSEIRSPSLTVFVVDTSIKTDRSSLETIRREIKSFIDAKLSQQDKIAVIASSSEPEILSELTESRDKLNTAVGKLTTTGGNSIRDGMLLALRMLTGLDNSHYRRAIIVFTCGDQPSPKGHLEDRAFHLVGEKNVQLYVLGFGSAEASFEELSATVTNAGGRFVLTDIANAPTAFSPIALEVQQ